MAAHVGVNDMMGFFLHGTGTALGDPIEITSLHGYCSRNLTGDGRVLHPKMISADKACHGHTEAAAGLAGFYVAQKSVFRMHSLPNPHLRTLNRHISYMLDSVASGAGNFMILPRERHSYSKDTSGTDALGISSFAFQGTNAHMVCCEARAQFQPQVERKYSTWQELKQSLNKH